MNIEDIEIINKLNYKRNKILNLLSHKYGKYCDDRFIGVGCSSDLRIGIPHEKFVRVLTEELSEVENRLLKLGVYL